MTELIIGAAIVAILIGCWFIFYWLPRPRGIPNIRREAIPPMPPVKEPKPDIPDTMGVIQSKNLKPGDVVVLRYKEVLPDNAFAGIDEVMTRQFPDNKFLVLHGGTEISVMSPEQMAEYAVIEEPEIERRVEI